MVKKAIDSRIPALIRNGIQQKKRSFFVIVGDRQKDVIVNLYHILLNVDVKLNKSVLWAYKNKLLGFSSHRKKREKKIKKEIKRGIRDPNTEDPFELFVSTQNIRYVYYKETEKILGNTYGMCILQDFEAVTPNLLARTIETVEGGGLVLLLLKGMSSLKQLYTLSMDVHSRYRTEAHGDVVGRFNERFILSLGGCESCLVVDDELNVLPISGGKTVQPLPPPDPEEEGRTPKARELREIKDSFADSESPVGSLITLAKTVDQANALLTFVDAIAEKTLSSTVTLTAARGRGKSAALGVAIAAAIAHGYSNIFITSPSPENLKTLFEFVLKGFDVLGYLDHVDYSVMQSVNPDFNKAIVRISIHRKHRQTIQYIQPQDAHTLGQAELLVIDEAAAIPLPLVRRLMGPYLVFMASTINGYEGTGRSLSLKLIHELREQSRGGKVKREGEIGIDRSSGKPSGEEGSPGGRRLREIALSEPIRYAPGDPVEKWLNTLLCLDATIPRKTRLTGCPDPSQCVLLEVNRDTLFSFHKVSEAFLQQMMALYVASHYKNSPNDLQLMSDAPAHHLFVLVPPVDPTAEEARLPEPLCVIQVALEGQISAESVRNSLSRGQRAGGDLIPWLVSQQFQDENFAGLSGARVVRIATNPDHIGQGYGSRALQLLAEFYEGKLINLSEDIIEEPETMVRVTDEELASSTLLQDNIKVRDQRSMPPLFSFLDRRKPPYLDWLGVSYGLTQPLHKFWKRSSFAPVYLRQTPNDLTGEHTCVMLRPLYRPEEPEEDCSDRNRWLGDFANDFHRRFLSLLAYNFRTFPSVLALSIDESASRGAALDPSTTPTPLTKSELDALFSAIDLKRLKNYADNMLDFHVILDMLPAIARLCFTGRLKPGVKLSGVQTSILLAVGLQHKDFEALEKELDLGVSQLLAMFVKTTRKVSKHFDGLVAEEYEKDIEKADKIANAARARDVSHDHDKEDGTSEIARRFKPLEMTLAAELEEAGDEVKQAEKNRIRSMIDALPLERYEIADGGADWEEAERQILELQSGKKDKSSIVSVKSNKPRDKRKAGEALEEAYREVESWEGKKFKKGSKSAR